MVDELMVAQLNESDNAETAQNLCSTTDDPFRTPNMHSELPTETIELSSIGKTVVESSSRDNERKESENGREPTELEKTKFRHVGESLPYAAWLVAFVELCERFTYYGCQGLFQNYIQRPLNGSEGRGALGLGHRRATALNLLFSFWSYVTPILGAIVADQYLGKYKTIVLFCVIYMVGLFILFVTSLPVSLNHGAGVGGFVTAIIVIGIGTGGIKSNVAPLIADQHTRRKMALSTLSSGERVVIDPSITIQRIYMIFYASINVGSLSLLATSYMERDTGFWSAYLLCFCMFVAGTTVLVIGRKHYFIRPPQGSVITDAFQAIGLMIRYRSQDAPKQSFMTERGISRIVPWDDRFVEELKRALVACRVFIVFPLYWVVNGQFSSNFVTQAGQMTSHGIPNDLMVNLNPIAIIVLLPVMDRFVYPWLRKKRIPFQPINRIVLGFWVASSAMAYGAFVQYAIYSAGPCYVAPLCEAAIVNGVAYGNNVHIALQTPAYGLIGISEIFTSVTGLEYAYTKAPPNMKSFVQAIYLLTSALGSALGEALTPLAYDPAILWMFVGLCATSFMAGCFTWLMFHHLNKTEDSMNALG